MASADPGRSEPSIPKALVDGLRERVRGSVFTESNGEYDSARRVFNAMIDRRPALILRCSGGADVVGGIHFARENGFALAVRGGGHGVAGKSVCDGGLMLDLSHMKGIRVDPARHETEAQPGILLGEFDRENHAFGMAGPMGIVSCTGIAGLTLGGGIGWLNGRHGLACDNLISADVVLADGRIVTASNEEHEDLFWAIRGGGGNFGVVTSFRFRVHALESVWGGMVIHPIDRARETLLAFDEFARGCSDDTSTAAAILTGPDGHLAVALAACFCGPLDEGENALRPLRSIGSPVADLFRPMPYPVIQTMLDGAFPQGLHHYWKAGFLERITDASVDTAVSFMQRKPSPNTIVTLQQLHGAAARVPTDATAFPHRASHYDFEILSSWSSPADSERNIDWTHDFYKSMEPFLESGVYVNGLGEEGNSRVRSAYGTNYPRLLELKRKYDPANLFRLNQNINPLQS